MKALQKFDHEPELKARIAQALLEDHHENSKTKLPIVLILLCGLQKDVLGISPRIMAGSSFCAYHADKTFWC